MSELVTIDQPAQLPAVSPSRSVSMADMQQMASAMAKSKLFGVKTPDEALALMLVSYAEGRHPALAARDYDIIQGRPAKKSEAMMRDFLESGGRVEWHQLDDKAAIATFSHPAGGSVKIDWTMARAVAAGLGGRDMWKKYPRQMLRSRTVSEGIRTVCPMATSGMYVPEEVSDIVREKNITPTAGAGDRLTVEQQDRAKSVADKVVEWINSGSIGDAYAEAENAGFDPEEKIYFWTFLDSKQRSAFKREGERVKAAHALPAPETAPQDAQPVAQDVITEAQRKRLEARITELGYKRDRVKLYVANKFGRAHFSELLQAEYATLDADLENTAFFNESAPPATPAGTPSAVTQGAQAGADTLTVDQQTDLADLCATAGISDAAFLKGAKAAKLELIPRDQYLPLRTRLQAKIAEAK